MARQREQMEEQKRQFEAQKAAAEKRYEEQLAHVAKACATCAQPHSYGTCCCTRNRLALLAYCKLAVSIARRRPHRKHLSTSGAVAAAVALCELTLLAWQRRLHP